MPAPNYLAQLTQALKPSNVSDGELIARLEPNARQFISGRQNGKTVVSVMLAIIIFVAAFNIVTSLIMMVGEKRSDFIAVLRTMGMSARSIVAVFMVQGHSHRGAGYYHWQSVGIGAALTISQIIEAIEALLGIQIFDPEVYFVSYFPSVWRWQDTLNVVLGASLTCVLASMYPAWRASQIAPAEALRYNI